MAHFHHVAAKQRPRPQRHASPSRYRDWEPRHESPLDSLPYRTLKPGVQRPDDRKLKHSSHRRTPLSEDLHVRGPMPPPPQLLIRSATVAHREGKGRLPYDADDDDADDDDDDDDGEQRLRARLRSRSRTRTRSVSSSRESDSVVMTTPTKSTNAYRSAPVSRHVSSSSDGSSDADSTSSESTQDARPRRRSRSLKERIQVPAVPDPISALTESPQHRRRHGRRGKNVIHLEQLHVEPEYEEPDTVDLKPSSSAHHRVQSESRSRCRRHHRNRDRYSEGQPSSSSRRPMMRRYYESDAGYPPRTLLPRSHQTSRSRAPSLRSVSSSSKRSSFRGGFFAPTAHQQHHSDKNAKTVECVVCLDDLPAIQAPKLKCGHRMCKTCLKRVFKLSIKDPQQMPPRCCNSECIPLKHVDKLFKDDFKRIWNRKFAEFSTRNRVYCPGKKCGEWIKPDQIHRQRNGRKIAKCSKCGTRVCCACNNKWHESRHCPMDEETDRVLQQAKERGWQRCFNCNAMVELKEGCNHMTCRCNAEFCMICGSKWKTCECPWFSYDTAEQDGLDDMEIPVPMVDRDRLGGSDTLPMRDYRTGATSGQGARFRPTTYEEEMHYRHIQEQRDEELARRLQYEDTDDEYLDGMGDAMGDVMGDVMGVGNATGHFMNENYRRGAQSVIAPQPPPAAQFERANSTVTDYVAGVNRSRGVRASSMERRLADRFEQRQGSSPTHRSFGHPIPPPPHPPRSMGPPPPPQPPGMAGMAGMAGMPGIGPRRHTAEDDLYDSLRNPRLAERMAPRRAATHDYFDEVAAYAPTGRRRHRERELPRDSVLAGLNGQGRGMNRVFEWRNYVEPVGPEHHHITTAS